MLQNAYFLAKIGADTAENEEHFAEILLKIGNYPMGRARASPLCRLLAGQPLVGSLDDRQAGLAHSGRGPGLMAPLALFRK